MVHFVERETIERVWILQRGRKPPCVPWQLLPTTQAVKSSVYSNPATVADPPSESRLHRNCPRRATAMNETHVSVVQHANECMMEFFWIASYLCIWYVNHGTDWQGPQFAQDWSQRIGSPCSTPLTPGVAHNGTWFEGKNRRPKVVQHVGEARRRRMIVFGCDTDVGIGFHENRLGLL